MGASLDGRLNVSVAGYTMRYEGVQLPGIVFQQNLGNAVSLVENLGNADNTGFELELTALPTPNFHLSAGLAYLDSKYRTVYEPAW